MDIVSATIGVQIQVKTYLDSTILDGNYRMPVLPPEGSRWSFGTGVLGELVTFLVAKQEFSTLLEPYKCDDCDDIHIEQYGVNITLKLEPLGVNGKIVEDYKNWIESLGNQYNLTDMNTLKLAKMIQGDFDKDLPHSFVSYFKAAKDIVEIEFALRLLTEMISYLANDRCLGKWPEKKGKVESI